MSADRFISDVSNMFPKVDNLAGCMCPPIGSFPTSATSAGITSSTTASCVRRSVHFRRQQHEELRRYAFGDKCPPIGSFPTSATQGDLEGARDRSVSADRFISDVSNNHAGNIIAAHISVRRSVHFRRQQPTVSLVFSPHIAVSADRFISDVSNCGNQTWVFTGMKCPPIGSFPTSAT